MTILDISRRSALAAPVRSNNRFIREEFPHVVLQLDLPDANHELQKLFACQLVVDLDAWDRSAIGLALKSTNGKFSDDYHGTVHFSGDELVPRPHNQITHSLLMVDVLGTGYRINIDPDLHISLNAVIRVHRVERGTEPGPNSNNPVWLVRGTIDSGGLLFGEPTDNPNSGGDLGGLNDLKNRIWPQLKSLQEAAPERERLAGIFFTGSELQIEALAMSAGRPEVRRFRLLGVRRTDVGLIEKALWEHIAATKILSHIHGPRPTLVRPNAALEHYANLIKKITEKLRLKVVVPEGSRGGSVVLIENMQANPADAKRSEFLRVDWTLQFESHEQHFRDAFEWRPRTLVVQNAAQNHEKFTLIDADDVDLLLRAGRRSELGVAADVEFQWTSVADQPLGLKIPESKLTEVATEAGSTGTFPRDLWFLARCSAVESPYTKAPAVWANVTTAEPPGTPTETGIGAARLSGPLTFSRLNWNGAVIPAARPLDSSIATPRIELTLQRTGNASSAVLRVHNPDMKLDSPQVDFYDMPLNDPKSVPNERQPHSSRVTERGSLRFVYRSESVLERPSVKSITQESVTKRPEAFIRCRFGKLDGADLQFIVHRAPQAIKLFLPADRGLVDPVSVTRGNLVAVQTVAFPVFELPPQSKATLFLSVTDVRPASVPDASTEIDLAVPAELEVKSQDLVKELQDLRGFFVALRPAQSDNLPTIVARLKGATNKDASAITLHVGSNADVSELSKSDPYRLMVGPTRLALPRDVNHGLIPIDVGEFWFENNLDFPVLAFRANHVRGTEVQSVLGLHPWSEWGPDPKNWIKTGRARLHHRNLIQEHAEFESSFEDRFPPEGPTKDPETGRTPSPLLPLADFLRAVRDRYTAASGNLLKPSRESTKIRNWMPGSEFIIAKGTNEQPSVSMDLSKEIPIAELRPGSASGDLFYDPCSKLPQSLALRTANDKRACAHWLDVDVRPELFKVGSVPKIRLTPTDAADVTSRRAVDSSVPLLFSRHDVSALASIDVPGHELVVMAVGGPETPPAAYLFTASGKTLIRLDSISELNKGLLDICLLRHKTFATTRLRGLAITNEEPSKLLKFDVNAAPDGLSFVNVTDVTPSGTQPKALASGPESASPEIVLLAKQNSGDVVLVFNIDSGAITQIGQSRVARPTAVSMDRTETEVQVAIGYDNGTVQLFKKGSGTWIQELVADRSAKGPILGRNDLTEQQILAFRIPVDRSIRSIALCSQRSGVPLILACDGSRFVSTWGFAAALNKPPSIWLHPSDALSVAGGQIYNLESRPEADNTAPVPAFAVGRRSGEVLVSVGLAEPTVDKALKLIDVRFFDTSTAPITRITLPGLSPELRGENRVSSQIPPIFAGTAAGTILGWHLRTGLEWPSGPAKSTLPRIAPKTFLDALGVIRESSRRVASNVALTVERLSIGTANYYSLSTDGFRLAGKEPEEKENHTEHLTDIRLWANSFKLRTDGSVDSIEFPDGPFAPGELGFFSEIVSEPGSELEAFDHVPRIDGIPFIVTGIRSIKLNAALDQIVEVALDGVLINPDEAAVGQDQTDKGTIPGLVARALSRDSVLQVTLKPGEFKDWVIDSTASEIDWTFAVNLQQRGEDGFPGKIARVVSKKVIRHDALNRLCFVLDHERSSILAFSRLWQFGSAVEGLLLVANSYFQRNGNDSPWRQVRFGFRTEQGINLIDTGERLGPEQVWDNPANDHSLIAVNPTNFARDSQGASPDRYVSFFPERSNKVYIADNTTGLAAKATADLFETSAAEVSSTGIVESIELPRLDERPRTFLTVAVGRVSTSGDAKGRIEFIKVAESAVHDAQAVTEIGRASWESESIKGRPSIRLTHAISRQGIVQKREDKNGLVRLISDPQSLLPNEGEPINLVFNGEPGTGWPSRTVALDVNHSERTFGIANVIDSATVDDIRFLRLMHRINQVEAVGDDYRLTLAVRDIDIRVNDRVLCSKLDGTLRLGSIKSSVGNQVLVTGLAAGPAVGDRLQRLETIDDVIAPGDKRPTIRVKTNPGLRNGEHDRFVLIHVAENPNGVLHLISNVTTDGFDLYRPGKLVTVPDPNTQECTWRPVQTIKAIDASKTHVLIDLGTHSLPHFAEIQLFGIQGDHSLSRKWFVIPEASRTNRVILVEMKLGDGNAISDRGEWSAGGNAAKRIADIKNDVDEQIVITTSDEHELADGALVEITGVVGSDLPNGLARIKQISAVKFALYAMAPSPASARGGYWEQFDRDTPISGIDANSHPTVLVSESGTIPAELTLFRIVVDGTPIDPVFVAHKLSHKKWEMWQPILDLAIHSSWSTLHVADQHLTGTPMHKLRLPHANLPLSFGMPGLAYDKFGDLAIAGSIPLRVQSIHPRWVYIDRELPTSVEGFPVSWRALQPIGVVSMHDNSKWEKRIQFDYVPDFPDSQTRRIEGNSSADPGMEVRLLETARCGPHVVAVSADGAEICLWHIEVIRPNIVPSLRVPGGNSILALAVKAVSNGLLVAARRATAIDVYFVDDSLRDYSSICRIALADDSGTTSSLALAELDQEVVLASGGNLGGGQGVLTFWRLPYLIGNPLVTGEAVKIWKSIDPIQPIISLSVRQLAGCPQFLIGFADRVEVWSPQRMLIIRSDSNPTLSPRASLPIDLGLVTKSFVKLHGFIKPTRILRFGIEKAGKIHRAYTRLRQGNYRCLIVSPTVPDASRGLKALLIWPTGDLTGEPMPPQKERSLSAASLSLLHNRVPGNDRDSTPHELKIVMGGIEARTMTWQLREIQLLVEVFSANASPTTRVSSSGTVHVSAELGSHRLRFLLEGEIGQGAESTMSGILTAEELLPDDAPSLSLLQANVRCKLNREAGALKVITVSDDVFWSTQVRLSEIGSLPKILLPRLTLNDRQIAYEVASFSPVFDGDLAHRDVVNIAKNFFASGTTFPGGSNDFVCQVLGIPMEASNALMGQNPVFVGKDNSYHGLVPGDIVGWKSTSGLGHVAIYIGEPTTKFLHVSDTIGSDRRPQRLLQGFGQREIFRSLRFGRPRTGFVHLTFVEAGARKLHFAVETVKEDRIALIPELEPTRVRPPNRLDETVVRLVHRRRSGLALRPHISESEVFQGGIPRDFLETAIIPSQEWKTLLDSVIADDKPLMRLRPEGWLARITVTSDTPTVFRTNGLFVVNADSVELHSRDEGPALVSALESRTQEVVAGTVDLVRERNRYRGLLRDAGAQGVAVQFGVTDLRAADLAFIDSPFYDHAGIATDSDTSPNDPPDATEFLTQNFARISQLFADRPESFSVDPRLVFPAEVSHAREKPIDAEHIPFRYIVDDLPSDPYADVACLAHRRYRLYRDAAVAAPEVFDELDTPIVHSSEVPAFRQSARLSHRSSNRWMYSRSAMSNVFFPKRIDWEVAADKPGAMFHFLVQARITNASGSSQREPLIDFAFREPQFVRLNKCVSAEVEWQTDTRVDLKDHRADVKLVWKEIIGRVSLENLATSAWLQPIPTGIGFIKPPLQLIIDFNSEVIAVQQADAAVLAYRVEAQPDENSGGEPNVKLLPAATFLVTKVDADARLDAFTELITPQLITLTEIECDVTSSGGEFHLTTESTAIEPGVCFDFEELPQVAVVTVSHRLVKKGNAPIVLMQDTVHTPQSGSELGKTVEIEYEGGSEKKQATIISHRPFCIKIDGLGGDDDLTGLRVERITPSIDLRRISDAEELAVAQLRLCKIAQGQHLYLVVTPSPATNGIDESGTIRRVFTKAAGYLEASVRSSVKIEAVPNTVWSAGLRIAKEELDNKTRIPTCESTFIQISNAKQPRAVGVFRLLKDPKADYFWLARPSVGNGLQASTGRICTIPTGTELTIRLVEGNTPIMITTSVDTDPDEWPTGTAVRVVGVDAVPQANGTWIVERIDEKQFALYEPSVFGTEKNILTFDGVISQVWPLAEAFEKDEAKPELARLRKDLPKWEEPDRPLLQVYWSGTADFANEDGSGIAWRRGGTVTQLYEHAKQIKFLANSQLSPKLVFVLSVGPDANAPIFQRTILFGDAAPAFDTKPVIVGNDFVLELPNNQESLSVQLPKEQTDKFVLYIVKSLPSGVAVMDRLTNL